MKMNNKPLTLEELRKMDGKPVWVQDLEYPDKSQWRLCYWDRGKYLVLQGISTQGYLLEDYGEIWVAYAYEPPRLDRSAWEPCEYCRDYSGKCCANCWNGGKQAYQEPCKSCYCASKWKPKENFCPYCGRPMHDAAWETLYQKIGDTYDSIHDGHE